MDNNNGYVILIVIVVMSILLIMVLHLAFTVNIESLILSFTSNNIQSFYQSEGKALMSLHNEDYYQNQLYPVVVNAFRNTQFGNRNYINILQEDLEFGDDLSSIVLTFHENNNRKEFSLVSESNCKGVINKLISSGTLVNELFELGIPILDISCIDDVYEDSLREILEDISNNISIDSCYKTNNIYSSEHDNFNDIVLSKIDSNNHEIAFHRETMANPYIERFNKQNIFLICKKKNNDKLNFRIDSSGQNITLSGIIYIEGDLIISSSFIFNGIIIVKDGEIIIESINNPRINGLLILDNVINSTDVTDSIDIKFNKNNIYKFGTYLPAFLQPKINTIKSN